MVVEALALRQPATEKSYDWTHDPQQAIAYVAVNPKISGSQAHVRYEHYKRATTVGRALQAGAARGDLKFDWERGFLTLRRPALSRLCCLAPSARAPRQFTCIVSLGTRCLVANALESAGKRTFSLPFDYIYTCPAMVAHCLRTDFKCLLKKAELLESRLLGSYGGVGHRLYSSMLSRRVVFPHHDPLRNAAHRESFQRKVARFRRLVALPGKKLMVLAELCNSAEALAKARAHFRGGGELLQLFSALMRLCGSFELQVVTVVTGKASGGRGRPACRHVFRHREGRAGLVVHELHCVGDCTGAYLRDPRDERAFLGLLTKDRSFRLGLDPLEEAERKRRSATAERGFKARKLA